MSKLEEERFFQEICRVLGIQQDELIEWLKTKATVVVIDNTETAPFFTLRKIRNLIDAIPLSSGTKFVITSRTVINLFTEKVEDRIFSLNEGLDVKSASEYLVILSKKQIPPLNELIKAADWVAMRVQGHPKVLEIITGAVRLRGWQRVRSLLDNLGGELAERIQEIYSGSISLLDEEDRKILPCFTLLPTARFSLADITTAIGNSSSVRAIEHLADAGLISYDPHTQYITIHQTVYDYLREHYKIGQASRSMAYFRLAEHYGNQGDLGIAVWMWCKATGKDGVPLDTAISMWSETVREWLTIRNQAKRLTRACT